jgi:saccharopine dehydrogenase-like NADP-dependent oxidoreductase
MKVLLLGGTGLFGRQAAALLARENLVAEIGIASRHLEVAQGVAEDLGNKACAVCVDIKDLIRLSSIAGGYHIIVNAAGPTSAVQVPAIQAAIEAGVHYCDLGMVGRTTEIALQLDVQARSRGVTAIIGTGWFAITSLMAVHAVNQLDETEEVNVCMSFDISAGSYYSPEQSLARARELGHVDPSWEDPLENARGPVLTFRAGYWIRVEPDENPIEIVHPSGYRIIAYPVDSTDSVTLPPSLPGVKTVSSLFSFIPPQLNELYLRQGRRIAAGETDPAGATLAFLEEAVADKERRLTNPPGYPSGYMMWVVATGRKNGRQVRYLCWPEFILDWTNVPLVIIALRLLRGEVSMHGVLPPQACFTLASFFEEASWYVSGEHRGKPLLNERFEWLE